MLAGEPRREKEEKHWPPLTLAITAYHSHCHAQGSEPKWESLEEDEQMNWLRLGGHALDLFTKFDGCKVAVLLPEAWKTWVGHQGFTWEADADQIAFEAAIRQLYQVLDSDDELDLNHLEARWAEWAVRKREEMILKG